MYQALYRTWRPQTFDEVIGQPSVSQTLKAQVESGRLSHAYLFTGTRGTGKTSCARILAKAVNCLNQKDGNPCNQCSCCKSIDDGTSMDVTEIDAASNNGVDNIRALREEANYTPVELMRRVYIIDEVHMLSNSAFNALLKTIEEPPEHLLFILATTELNKVPATILSRCQRFSFRRLSQKDIAARINEVAYNEGIDIEADAVRLLARLADGAMRDALSLLDQCSSAVGKLTLTAQSVYDILGLIGHQQTIQIMENLLDGHSDKVMQLFDNLYQAGKSIPSMLEELGALSRDLLLLKTIPQGAEDLLSGTCTPAEAKDMTDRISAGELMYYISEIQKTTSGFSQSVNPKLEAELCLLRLCQPQLRLEAEAINARLSRVEEQLASGIVLTADKATAKQIQSKSCENSNNISEKTDDARSGKNMMPAFSLKQDETGAMCEDNFWPQLIERLKPDLGPPTKGFFAINGPVSYKIDGEFLTLLTDDFPYSYIKKPEVLQLVSQKASIILNRPIQARACLLSTQAQTNAAFESFVDNAKRLDDGTGLICITED